MGRISLASTLSLLQSGRPMAKESTIVALMQLLVLTKNFDRSDFESNPKKNLSSLGH